MTVRRAAVGAIGAVVTVAGCAFLPMSAPYREGTAQIETGSKLAASLRLSQLEEPVRAHRGLLNASITARLDGTSV